MTRTSKGTPMTIPESHKRVLAQKGYPLQCKESVFTEQERVLLDKYGYWLEALASGAIPAYTPAQQRFVQVHNEEVAAVTEYELAWEKLQFYRRRNQGIDEY